MKFFNVLFQALFVASCLAMEAPSQAALLESLNNGDYNRARLNLSVMRLQDLARIPTAPNHFDFFKTVPELKFPSEQAWENFKTSTARLPFMREILTSRCQEATARWRELRNRDRNDVSKVEAMFTVNDINEQYKRYKAEEARRAREREIQMHAAEAEHQRILNLASTQALNDVPGADPHLTDVVLDDINIEDYQGKVDVFRRMPEMRDRHGFFSVTVARGSILRDSFNHLSTADPEALKSNLKVRFDGEAGIDVGGPRRELFTLIASNLLHSSKALFSAGPGDDAKISIHPDSNDRIRRDRNLYQRLFKFAGRLFGLAIYYKVVLPAKFSSSLFKVILDHPLRLQDYSDFDSFFCSSMNYILGVEDEDVMEGVSVTFTFEDRPIVPNGDSIDVTVRNKRTFVRKSLNYLCIDRFRQQIQWIREGLFEIVPEVGLQIFTPHEIELMIGGSPTIELEDWKRNTEYSGCNANDPFVRVFWECIAELSPADMSKFLIFATGSSSPPVGGFAFLIGRNNQVQKFKITPSYGDAATGLMDSHTCFNQIDVPRTTDQARMRRLIQIAIEHRLSFGMG